MNDYVTPTYQDPEASKYAWGTAFHWYANSELEENNWYAEELDEITRSLAKQRDNSFRIEHRY